MIPETRPFDIRASDLDALIELNADNMVNKNYTLPFSIKCSLQRQTVLTLGVMDLVVDNSASRGVTQRFLNLTAPHSLVCISFHSP